jgi:tRNA (cytidine/uridine-2'-O-)-methyltransferase
MVEASGFIWEMKGQAVKTVPTAAAAPVATKRKSRRVESAEDAVVTIPNPFSAAAGGAAPGNDTTPREAAGARDPRGGRKTTFSDPIGRNKQSRIVLLAPLPDERKPAIGWPACNALIDDLSIHFTGDPKGRNRMQIALFQPDIPQNTGTILRLCACMDVTAHIIEPAGFPISDRHFRRAGMDYLDQVTLMRHDSWSKFEQWRNERGNRLILFTTRGASSYLDYHYAPDDILLFGRESAGVPDEVAKAADARLVIPIKPGLRSLNVAMAAAMALGEALRQTSGVNLRFATHPAASS